MGIKGTLAQSPLAQLVVVWVARDKQASLVGDWTAPHVASDYFKKSGVAVRGLADFLLLNRWSI